MRSFRRRRYISDIEPSELSGAPAPSPERDGGGAGAPLSNRALFSLLPITHAEAALDSRPSLDRTPDLSLSLLHRLHGAQRRVPAEACRSIDAHRHAQRAGATRQLSG